jgi:hypothetical protein
MHSLIERILRARGLTSRALGVDDTVTGSPRKPVRKDVVEIQLPDGRFVGAQRVAIPVGTERNNLYKHGQTFANTGDSGQARFSNGSNGGIVSFECGGVLSVFDVDETVRNYRDDVSLPNGGSGSPSKLFPGK